MVTALFVIDMQKYYLSPDAPFHQYYAQKYEGSMDYITEVSKLHVIPNIRKLISFFRDKGMPVYYLRLCGTDPERKDLHRYFRTAYLEARDDGVENLYPLCDDHYADVIDEIKPGPDDRIFTKTTFSPFNSTSIYDTLKEDRIETIVFTGLATSQCVETTARDASDKGFSAILIDDAQVDYSEESHYASLFSSQPVLGGWVYNTDQFILQYKRIIDKIEDFEMIDHWQNAK